MKGSIYNKAIARCDETNSKDIEDESNAIGCSESQGVLHDQEESVPCGCTEVFARECDLI
jgi:hypothetical protein